MSKLFLSIILSLLIASACANNRFFMRFTQENVVPAPADNSTIVVPENANVTIPETANVTIPEDSSVNILPEEQNTTIPAETVPVETVPVETVPVETVPVETVPVETVPVETVPVETVPVETVPVETVPVETVPVETVPVETVPVETVPVETVPVEQNTTVPATNTTGASFFDLNSTQFIKVIGRSSGKVKLGQVIIGLTLETIDRSAANSLSNNTQIVNSTMEQLRSLGLSEEDIQVSGIQVFPFYESFSTEVPKNTTTIINNSTIPQPQNITAVITNSTVVPDSSAVPENPEQPANSTDDSASANLFNQTLNSTGLFDENQEINTDNLFNQTLNETSLFNDTQATNQTFVQTTVLPQQEQASSVRAYSYRVRNSLIISTNNTELVGQILDSAISGGFNQVDFVNYLPLDDDIQTLRESLIGDAIDNAERSARKVIDKLGYEMGLIWNITLLEDQSNQQDVMYALNTQVYNPPLDYEQAVEVIYWMKETEESQSS